MKLFISWSGEFSQKVAEKLSIWIPTIIQSVEVFYSPEDIAKGENWSNRLSEELDNCSFGIICLTPENVAAPWIHFEAGALSKSLNARVSAIMLNVSPSDVKGPLAYYQNTAFERNDFFRLFQSINKSSDTPLKPEILKNAFNNAWENLKAEIESIIKNYPASKEETAAEDHNTSDSDAVQEILRLVRKMDSSRVQRSRRSLNYSQSPKPDSHTSLVSDNAHIQRVGVIASPSDIDAVYSILCDYIPPQSKRREFLSELAINGSCSLFVPESDVPDLRQRLTQVGAHLIEL